MNALRYCLPLLLLASACAPGSLPSDPVPASSALPSDKVPAAIPDDQADNVPIPPLTSDLLPPPLKGQIAYLSNRDQQTGRGSLENAQAVNETQRVSPYLYRDGRSRRLGSYTLMSAENLSLGFVSPQQMAYLVPEDSPEKLGLYRQSLDFTGVAEGQVPAGNLWPETLPMLRQTVSMHVPRWGVSTAGEWAVIKQGPDQNSQIWVSDASGLRPVTQFAGDGNYYWEIDEVHWSPSGQALLYTLAPIGALPAGVNPGRRLMLMARDGSNSRDLGIAFPVRQVQWSPDGRHILFTGSDPADKALRDQLYVVQADGTDLKRLTQTQGDHYYGKWSPDGRRIVYVNNTKDYRRLCPNPPQIFPPPSPEDQAAAEAYLDCVSAGEEIALIQADGSGYQNLTRNEAQDTYPVWSPDGQYLAFTSRRDGNREIYIMQPNGSQPTNISQHPAEDSRPVWGP